MNDGDNLGGLNENTATGGDGMPDVGSIVSKLLANPELISQIARTVGVGGGVGGASAAGMTQQAQAEPQYQPQYQPPPQSPPQPPPSASAGGGLFGGASAGDAVASVMSALGGLGGKPQPGAARRAALLSSLKPYCNEHRCKTIDYMISISKITDVLRPGTGGQGVLGGLFGSGRATEGK